MADPVSMPTDGVASQMFEPQRVDYLSPEVGGRIGGVTAGPALWAGQWTLGTMAPETGDVWRAFVARQRGPQRRFYGYDLSRPFPRAHRGGFFDMVRGSDGSAFPEDGAASSWAPVNAERDVIVLKGMPAGLTLGFGDYVGFRWGGTKRDLTRSVQAVAVANAAGDLQVEVEPPVWASTPTDAVAYLGKPDCLMALVPGQTALGELDELHSLGGRIVAIQDLIA